MGCLVKSGIGMGGRTHLVLLVGGDVDDLALLDNVLGVLDDLLRGDLHLLELKGQRATNEESGGGTGSQTGRIIIIIIIIVIIVIIIIIIIVIIIIIIIIIIITATDLQVPPADVHGLVAVGPRRQLHRRDDTARRAEHLSQRRASHGHWLAAIDGKFLHVIKPAANVPISQ
jgi:hypothetical protein